MLSTKALMNALSLLIGIYCISSAAYSDEAEQNTYRVKVATAFINVYTGPGKGFPQFYIVERGEWVEIISRKTDWFKVRLTNQQEGWLHREQLAKTRTETGEIPKISDATIDDYFESHWELGLTLGDFGGANTISLISTYSATPNLSVELTGSQITGNFSDGFKTHVNVVHEGFPDQRISPYFSLGVGWIQTDPKSTLVGTENRDDELLTAGVGLKVYITRNLIIRGEYAHYIVLTERETNEEVERWSIGIGIFF